MALQSSSHTVLPRTKSSVAIHDKCYMPWYRERAFEYESRLVALLQTTRQGDNHPAGDNNYFGENGDNAHCAP
eukprot:CAMPEP_0119289064 /NCGR_PEP_ID=MMETSP1329-20130426/38359_1 /TAXON_ID=114041 /ORGANISM="Genus nov. species nov., Strain RCC1024" /LENGTH=72 /DNA_ID=CAMNT_0007289849 /DNA_START=773 /DNA_END=991 /DNA_ORIENTATION=+